MTTYCCAARTCARCVDARKQRAEWDANIARAESTWGLDDHDLTIADICTSANESLKNYANPERLRMLENEMAADVFRLRNECEIENARLRS